MSAPAEQPDTLSAPARPPPERGPGFLEREKVRQAALKTCRVPLMFTAEAAPDGAFHGKCRPFCLHEDHSDENLAPSVREGATAYFRERGIGWHGGRPASGETRGAGWPSNHLCDSQTSCVNALFPFRAAPERLAAGLQALPALRALPVKDVLPFDPDTIPDGTARGHVAFEWIDVRNRLGERHLGKVATPGQLRRGRNATSADFAFRVRLEDGRVALVLGEWKYCERYGPRSLRFSGKTDRLGIYRAALERLWPGEKLPYGVRYEDLFYDPFDQLMRLQLLANEFGTVRSDSKLPGVGDPRSPGPHEMRFDFACVLHVAPRANAEFRRRVTAENLKPLGNDVHAVWARLAPEGRFFGVDAEDLLAALAKEAPDPAWATYMKARYLPMR